MRKLVYNVVAEWERLSQIHKALKTFNDLTHLVSISRPQINLTVLIYYKLYDLLRDNALVGYDNDRALLKGPPILDIWTLYPLAKPN